MITQVATIPFVRTGSYPVRAGNTVRPLVDGEAAFRRLCEAIDAARRTVWGTVTFMWPSFEMPDGRGSALDVLDSAARRGIDVRLLFWRPDTGTEDSWPNAFRGSEEQRSQLETRRSRIRIRWDRAQTGYCQHQKSWLIDAGEDGETAFLGGINLNPHSVVAPGHQGEGQNHDVNIEVTGPSVVDLHHNFVQRWNEASERFAEDGLWGPGSETDLPFPTRVPAPRGNARVQIQRTMPHGRITDGRPASGGKAFDIASGERSIFDQYCTAIGAARRSIYIENQYIEVPEIVACLKDALERGVEVVALVPSTPIWPIDPSPERQAFLEARAALGAFDNFTLTGIAGLGPDGRRKPVYVHSKLMLIDDSWGTVGSCNLHHYSLFGSGEMNASFWCRDSVRALRSELFLEHLGQDTSRMGDRDSLRLFRRVALENRARLDSGNHAWEGLAFALDPADYGR